MAAVLCLSCVPLRAWAASDSLQTVLDAAGQAERLLGGGTADGLLNDQNACPAGSNFCDWAAFAMAITGQQEDYDTYLTALEHYVTQMYMDADALTEINGRHRIALAVLAMGGDPTAFGTAADGSKINLVADSTYAYPGDLEEDTTNRMMYALVLLDAKGYPVPDDAKYTREGLLQMMLDRQNPESGGFGLTAGGEDLDITSMTLQALAPYRDDEKVQKAIDAGLDFIQKQMDENGYYVAFGTDSSESLSQVILALCALGIDPDTDERFCAGDITPTQAQLSYQLDDGGFRHVASDTEGNFIATQQAMMALEGVRRLRAGEPGIYDFTAAGSAGVPVYVYIAGGAVLVLALVIVLVYVKKRGKKDV